MYFSELVEHISKTVMPVTSNQVARAVAHWLPKRKGSGNHWRYTPRDVRAIEFVFNARKINGECRSLQFAAAQWATTPGWVVSDGRTVRFYHTNEMVAFIAEITPTAVFIPVN